MSIRSSIHLSTFRKIRSLLTVAERRGAIVLLGLIIIGMVVETLGVGLVLPAIMLLTGRDLANQYPALRSVLDLLGSPGQQELVVGGMLLLVGVYLAKAIFLAMLVRQQARFVFGVQANLSLRLFGVYLCQPWAFHLQRNSAQLISNVNNDVTEFAMNGVQATMSLFSESLVLLGLGTLLLVVEPLGTMIMVCVLGIAAWSFNRLTRRLIARSAEARRHHDGMRLQHLQQGLGGVKDAKLLGREAEFQKQYRVHNTESARAGQLLTTLQQLPRLWLEVLAVSGFAALVISMVAQGRTLETIVATLALFAAAVFRLIPSVNRVLGAVQSLGYASLAVNALHAEFDLAVPAAVGPRTPAAPLRESLELSEISFRYLGADAPALTGLSLVIHRGECVGLVGASGAGKSTLVDILLGLLASDSGQVRVDGVDIRHSVRNWQDQIGYVPQSIFLTDDTMTRNVAFGLPDEEIDIAAVWRAVRAAQLEDFVRGLRDGLDTYVGERGVRLSGGQRQRIGIARALYHDPAVLVLDEATSFLDTATERDVMQAVRALHGTKTILIVAHRLSTVEQCDRLYRIEHGRLVEEL